MRKTKTVYSFDNSGFYLGTRLARESWGTVNTDTPIWLLPADSTEVEVPIFDIKTEQAFFNKESNNWEVKQIPTEENTPKPDFDSNTHKIIWSVDRWVIEELPTQENTPKPEYDESVYTCDWVIDNWVLNIIPTWDIVRSQRDSLLKDSDWAIISDATPKPSKAAWLDYRQALRDIPQNFSTPEEVIFPNKPE